MRSMLAEWNDERSAPRRTFAEVGARVNDRVARGATSQQTARRDPAASATAWHMPSLQCNSRSWQLWGCWPGARLDAE